ncbi:hypothetical protein [Janibacter corallicola]|uniref:hypothetical protein n=1 Tax=Janibacter corallicola TaxID=415212 RepID=UPI0009FC9EB2|nr:hypothetical protein [Janibacter corallicola]
MTLRAEGVVRAGHGVASGRAADSPFATGTIALQAPHFAARGLDLSRFVPATVNLDIAPLHLVPLVPRWTFADVAWTDVHGPETFSFIEATVSRAGREHEGLVYLPHPETKPMHHQPGTVVELLLPRLDGLVAGEVLCLEVRERQAHMENDT